MGDFVKSVDGGQSHIQFVVCEAQHELLAYQCSNTLGGGLWFQGEEEEGCACGGDGLVVCLAVTKPCPFLFRKRPENIIHVPVGVCVGIGVGIGIGIVREGRVKRGKAQRGGRDG